RGQASPVVDHPDPRPAGRRTGGAGRPALGRRAGCAGSRVPPPVDRAAGGLRPAPPPRAAPDRDRRDDRHPGGDGPPATALRDPDAAGGHRGRRGAGRSRRTDGMTARIDLDGKLRAWLDLMPDEAPDHAIAAVLDAVDAMPQPRPSRRWPTRRTPMNRSFAALAAAVVIVVVGAALLLRPGNASLVATVPSASVAPAPSAAGASPSAAASAAAALPDALQHGWYGGLRAMGGDPSPTGVHLVIGPSTFVLSAANRQDYPFMHGDMSL